MAGQKIVTELHRMIERPEYATISRENEGEETTIFRLVYLLIIIIEKLQLELEIRVKVKVLWLG